MVIFHLVDRSKVSFKRDLLEYADYDTLRALDSDNAPAVPSMSDEEINSLPVHKYKVIGAQRLVLQILLQTSKSSLFLPAVSYVIVECGSCCWMNFVHLQEPLIGGDESTIVLLFPSRQPPQLHFSSSLH